MTYDFLNLIGKTKFAISMEESRYTLNGGLLILKLDTEVRFPLISTRDGRYADFILLQKASRVRQR